MAIKRLQARGLSLVELQRSLSGADDQQLYRWAGLAEKSWKRILKGAAVESQDRSPDAVLNAASAIAGSM